MLFIKFYSAAVDGFFSLTFAVAVRAANIARFILLQETSKN